MNKKTEMILVPKSLLGGLHNRIKDNLTILQCTTTWPSPLLAAQAEGKIKEYKNLLTEIEKQLRKTPKIMQCKKCGCDYSLSSLNKCPRCELDALRVKIKAIGDYAYKQHCEPQTTSSDALYHVAEMARLDTATQALKEIK